MQDIEKILFLPIELQFLNPFWIMYLRYSLWACIITILGASNLLGTSFNSKLWAYQWGQFYKECMWFSIKARLENNVYFYFSLVGHIPKLKIIFWPPFFILVDSYEIYYKVRTISQFSSFMI